MRNCGLMITAPGSGSGKTVTACALMAGFLQMGKKIRACKCGPDYIDPLFHKEVLGADSRNLDLFFAGEEELQRIYDRHASDAELVIVEGVMGYYDGISFGSQEGSSYEIGRILSLPAILVLPCKGMAVSVLALLKGFLEYQEDSNIKGIILNRISPALYPRMKEMIERGLGEMGHGGLKILGYLPEESVFYLKSRHLGLCLPEEKEDLAEQMAHAGERIRQTVDMEGILAIAGYGAVDGKRKSCPDSLRETAARVAVARDAAVCFYYQENLEYLKELGCELAFFSPLKDQSLPENCDGLLLGGGYPEIYAAELAANQKLLQEIREKVKKGLPCLAECGGFQYLQEYLEGSDTKTYAMAGVIAGGSRKKERLVRFGYVEIQGERDGAYLKQGETIRGHEFHYWDSSDNGKDCLAVKPDGVRSWSCIHMKGSLFAGYPHLYYPSNPEFAARFVRACMEYGKQRRSL